MATIIQTPTVIQKRPKSAAAPSFKIIGKIADGKFKVYKLYSAAQEAYFALKVFPKTANGFNHYKREKILAELIHPYIIQYIATQYNNNTFYSAMTEFAGHGDFFEIVTSGKLDSQILVRTYFHQLIDGIEYIQSKGFVHLDLKLENLMLGSDFTLKIIDFDQAQSTTDIVFTSGGTNKYRAPELMTGTTKNIRAADIYSAGIVLYTMLVKEFPFHEVEVKDREQVDTWYYDRYITKNDEFWNDKIQRFKDEDYFTSDFIELTNGMLERDPMKRMTITNIKESEWYNRPVLNYKVLKMMIQKKFSSKI